MDLKFYLNKFLKVDRVEDYTLSTLDSMKQRYDEFLEKSEGVDPDFPMMNFGNNKEKKIRGTNISTLFEEDE